MPTPNIPHIQYAICKRRIAYLLAFILCLFTVVIEPGCVAVAAGAHHPHLFNDMDGYYMAEDAEYQEVLANQLAACHLRDFNDVEGCGSICQDEQRQDKKVAVFFSISFPGHLTPMLSIAKTLHAQNWTVAIASTSDAKAFIVSQYPSIPFIDLGNCMDPEAKWDTIRRASNPTLTSGVWIQSSYEILRYIHSLHYCMYQGALRYFELETSQTSSMENNTTMCASIPNLELLHPTRGFSSNLGYQKNRIRVPDIFIVDFATHPGVDVGDHFNVPVIFVNSNILTLLTPSVLPTAEYLPTTGFHESIHKLTASYALAQRVLLPLIEFTVEMVFDLVDWNAYNEPRMRSLLPPKSYYHVAKNRLVLVTTSFPLEYNRALPPQIQLIGPAIDWKDETNIFVTKQTSILTVDELRWLSGESISEPNYHGQASRIDNSLHKIPTSIKGSIFVNFGTIAELDTNTLSMLYNVFIRLQNYSILWKIPKRFTNRLSKSGLIDDEKSKHIHIAPWFSSQTGILSHPFTKVFISHCGLNSAQESILLGVPLYCIPMLGDQADFAQRIEDNGVGKWSIAHELSEAKLLNNLLDILEHQERYRSAAKRVRDAMKLAGGNQRAVELIQFVARYGAESFMLANKDYPYWRLKNWDVFLVHFCIIGLMYGVIKWSVHSFWPASPKPKNIVT